MKNLFVHHGLIISLSLSLCACENHSNHSALLPNGNQPATRPWSVDDNDIQHPDLHAALDTEGSGLATLIVEGKMRRFSIINLQALTETQLALLAKYPLTITGENHLAQITLPLLLPTRHLRGYAVRGYRWIDRMEEKRLGIPHRSKQKFVIFEIDGFNHPEYILARRGRFSYPNAHAPDQLSQAKLNQESLSSKWSAADNKPAPVIIHSTEDISPSDQERSSGTVDRDAISETQAPSLLMAPAGQVDINRVALRTATRRIPLIEPISPVSPPTISVELNTLSPRWDTNQRVFKTEPTILTRIKSLHLIRDVGNQRTYPGTDRIQAPGSRPDLVAENNLRVALDPIHSEILRRTTLLRQRVQAGRLEQDGPHSLEETKRHGPNRISVMRVRERNTATELVSLVHRALSPQIAKLSSNGVSSSLSGGRFGISDCQVVSPLNSENEFRISVNTDLIVIGTQNFPQLFPDRTSRSGADIPSADMESMESKFAMSPEFPVLAFAPLIPQAAHNVFDTPSWQFDALVESWIRPPQRGSDERQDVDSISEANPEEDETCVIVLPKEPQHALAPTPDRAFAGRIGMRPWRTVLQIQRWVRKARPLKHEAKKAQSQAYNFGRASSTSRDGERTPGVQGGIQKASPVVKLQPWRPVVLIQRWLLRANMQIFGRNIMRQEDISDSRDTQDSGPVPQESGPISTQELLPVTSNPLDYGVLEAKSKGDASDLFLEVTEVSVIGDTIAPSAESQGDALDARSCNPSLPTDDSPELICSSPQSNSSGGEGVCQAEGVSGAELLLSPLGTPLSSSSTPGGIPKQPAFECRSSSSPTPKFEQTPQARRATSAASVTEVQTNNVPDESAQPKPLLRVDDSNQRYRAIRTSFLRPLTLLQQRSVSQTEDSAPRAAFRASALPASVVTQRALTAPSLTKPNRAFTTLITTASSPVDLEQSAPEAKESRNWAISTDHKEIIESPKASPDPVSTIMSASFPFNQSIVAARSSSAPHLKPKQMAQAQQRSSSVDLSAVRGYRVLGKLSRESIVARFHKSPLSELQLESAYSWPQTLPASRAIDQEGHPARVIEQSGDALPLPKDGAVAHTVASLPESNQSAVTRDESASSKTTPTDQGPERVASEDHDTSIDHFDTSIAPSAGPDVASIFFQELPNGELSSSVAHAPAELPEQSVLAPSRSLGPNELTVLGNLLRNVQTRGRHEGEERQRLERVRLARPIFARGATCLFYVPQPTRPL